MSMRYAPGPSARGQIGATVIELMVGFAVGLFIVGGAIKLFVDYLGRNRTVVLETRVNQDVRAAADLIARDLRRAGYWQNGVNNVWNATTTSFNTNNYRTITVDTVNGSNRITFAYSHDGNDNPDSGENRGFAIGTNGTLQMLHGGSWQPVTDPNTVTLTMTITPTTPTPTVELWSGCPCFNDLSCADADFQTGGSHYDTRPRAEINDYVIVLTGTSATDSTVRRSIVERVRVRNDKPSGACP